MAEVVAIVAKQIAQIWHQLGCLTQNTSNIDSLIAEVERLNSAQHGVQRSVDEAERNGQVIPIEVQRWLTSVNMITEELDNFFRDEVNQNQRCSSFSSCPNLVLRYKVSRKVKKAKLVVVELLLNGKFDVVFFAPPPPPIPESMNVRDVEVFKSRDSTYNGIIQALKDDKTNIIGVYGMGGIGKTKLVMDVSNQLVNEHKLFDKIVMVVVSQNPSITKIQDEIASMLDLKLDERDSVFIRADKLCESIKKSRWTLVILDDLWTKLDLKEIGLPHLDVHKGCKILLTTRVQHVCVEMRTQKKFPIDVLSELEAWDLFKKEAGDVVDSSDLKLIATEVAKECAGLPLCIVTVARSLMEVKDPSVWRVSLRHLQNPSTRNIPGMSAKVYSSLKLSYDFVDDEDAKNCFLICCLAEKDSDIQIKNLVGFGIGLEIFKNGDTLLQIKDTVRASMTKLEDMNLLLESKYVDCVRMHPVVQDFAISVVSEVRHWSWSRLDKNSISALNYEKFDYSKLKMLFLKSNDDSLVIPDKYFERMYDLRVLSMHIPKLQSSVLFLVNLRTLYLENCSVGDISFIGQLKCLEILSFVCCHIHELPREIEQLKRLRVLEMCKCVSLKVIPAGVISSLSQLEGLFMYMSLVDWGKDSNASLFELNGLPYLKTIDMHLPDVKLFPKDLHLESLSEFKISLGTEFSYVEWNDSFVPRFYEVDGFKCLYPRMLKVGNIDQSISSHDGVKMLVNQAESLIIEHLKLDLENIISELKREGFSRLKCFKVYKNQKTEYLVDTMKEKMLIFPVLEGLKLKDMENLKEICRGRLPSGSFCELCELELDDLPNLQNLWVGNASLLNLRVVKIRHCGKMKNLFSQNIVSGFGQLSSLEVKYCQNIEEILAYDRAEAIDEVEIELSKFKILKLTHLPNLTTFYSKRRNHISDGSVDAPPPIQNAFFSEKIAFPNLEELGVCGKFEEIWPQNIPGSSFCRLRVLDIGVFHKIKTAIPSNLVQRLQNLEKLTVASCELVEEVVEEVPKLKHMMRKNDFPHRELGEEEIGDMMIVLPRLKTITLMDLQTLVRFCNGNCTLELPLLKDLTIEWCPKLETLFMSFGCEGKESKTASSSNNAANLTEGFNREVQSFFNEKVLLPSLEELNIQNCECLRNILTPSIAKVLSSLTQIEISYCSSLEVVVAEEDQRREICMRPEEEENKIIIEFPQLSSLSLAEMPQLKCFYNGHCKLKFPSLATLHIIGCPMIETIFASNSFEGYKSTERRKQSYDQVGSTTSNAKMDDTMIPPMFFSQQVLLPNLVDLTIVGCGSLRNLLTPSVVKALSCLKELRIKRCSFLQQVVVEEEQRIQVSDQDKVIVFPQLRVIKLSQLPKLKSFYPGNLTIEFPSLIQLYVKECPHMQSFSPCHVVIPENTAVTAFYSREGDRITQDLFKTKGEKDEWKEKDEEEIASSSNLGEMFEKDENFQFSSNRFSEPFITSIETTTMPKMTPPLGEDASSVEKGKIDSISSKAEGMPSFPSPREQILEEMPSGMKGPRSTHETRVDNTASSVAEREGRINPEQSEITIEPTVYETESASLPGLTSAPSIETPAMPKMTPPLGGDVSSVEKGKIDSTSSKAEGMPSFPREEILEEMPSGMKGPRSTHETGVDNTASSVAEREGRINPEQSEITIEPTVYETESASMPGLTSAPSIETPAMPKITPPLGGDVSSVEKGKIDSISSKAEGMPSFPSPREEIFEEMPFGMKGPRSNYETRVDNTASSVAEREGRISSKQSEITIEPTVSEATSIKIKWPQFMHTELEIFQGASSVKLHDMNNDPGCLLFEADYYMSIRTSEKIEELTKMESDSSYIFKEDALLCGPLESPERTSFSLPEHSILRKAGAGLKEPPPETEWEQTSMVVLTDNEFSTLPKKPRCPNLAFLFLQRNNRLRTIPDLLFDDMASLRVLDLSNTRIRSLPPSLFKLTELQVLFLRKCDCLDELPHEVGDLQHLEVLDIWGTELYNLPDEIGKLICLKILQVTFYGSDDQIEYRNLPPKLVSDDIVSKLIVLEVLRIAVHPTDWRWNKSSEAITKNVSMLNNLTFLEFYFPEVKFLTHFIESSPSWRNRQLKFKFVVGQNIKRIVSRVPDDIESKYNHEDQSLRFVNGGKKLVEVVEVLERVTGFYLDHHLGICSLSEFGISNMLVLQFCLVRECPNIRVFIENEERSENVLPSLRHLSIHYLWKLEIIWKGPMTHGSLGELKVLSVHTCPKLEFIISQSMLQGLSNLEELVVDDCESVKEVIKWDENQVEGDINALPGLKKIKLHYLPELVSVCGVFPLLKQSDIYGCPKLPRLSVSSSTV